MAHKKVIDIFDYNNIPQELIPIHTKSGLVLVDMDAVEDVASGKSSLYDPELEESLLAVVQEWVTWQRGA